MRRKLASAVIGVGLLCGLGCSGISESLMSLSGTEVAMGDNAEHPDDFPLPPPPLGEIMTSLSTGLGGAKTTTVIYELDAEASLEVILPPYEEILKAHAKDGQVTRMEDNKNTTLVAVSEDEDVLTVSASKESGKTIFTLASVVRKSSP